jgi:hypothetical protein
MTSHLGGAWILTDECMGMLDHLLTQTDRFYAAMSFSNLRITRFS